MKKGGRSKNSSGGRSSSKPRGSGHGIGSDDRSPNNMDPTEDADEQDNGWDSTPQTTTPTDKAEVTTTSSMGVTSAFPTKPSTASQEGTTMGAMTTMSTSKTTVTATPSMDVMSTSPSGLSSVTQGTGSHSPIKEDGSAALVTTLPIVGVIFLLLLLVGFILLRKKSLRNKRSKQDAEKAHSKESQLELGDMKHTSNDYRETGENGVERKLAIDKQNATSRLTYNEVDEMALTSPEVNTTHTGIVVPYDGTKVRSEGSQGYEEVKVPGTPMNGTYEEVIDKDKNQGYEKAKGKGKHADQGNEAAKLANGSFYDTLNPAAQNDPSCRPTSVPGRKQDGGYDVLDRQKIPVSPRNKTDSNYDLTDRIWKGDAKVKACSQTDGEYSATCSSSANTSDYDKLEHTTRNQKADNISPNEYNILQPKGKA